MKYYAKSFAWILICSMGAFMKANAQFGKIKQTVKTAANRIKSAEDISKEKFANFKVGDRVRCIINPGILSEDKTYSLWDVGRISRVETFDNGDRRYYILFDSYDGEEVLPVSVKAGDISTAPLKNLSELRIITECDYTYGEAEKYGKGGSKELFRDKIDWFERIIGNMENLLTDDLTPGITKAIADYKEKIMNLKEKYGYAPKKRPSY